MEIKMSAWFLKGSAGKCGLSVQTSGFLICSQRGSLAPTVSRRESYLPGLTESKEWERVGQVHTCPGPPSKLSIQARRGSEAGL